MNPWCSSDFSDRRSRRVCVRRWWQAYLNDGTDNHQVAADRPLTIAMQGGCFYSTGGESVGDATRNYAESSRHLRVVRPDNLASRLPCCCRHQFPFSQEAVPQGILQVPLLGICFSEVAVPFQHRLTCLKHGITESQSMQCPDFPFLIPGSLDFC